MSSFQTKTNSTDVMDSSAGNQQKIRSEPHNQSSVSNPLWTKLATSSRYQPEAVNTANTRNLHTSNSVSIKAKSTGRKAASIQAKAKVNANKPEHSSSDQKSNLSADVPTLGSGEALSGDLRNYFEPRFGVDFSNVRIHRDTNTANYADNINARAFTYGNNIGFSNGAFSSDQGGKKLLAHELTHVIQQGQARPQNNVLHREVAFTNCKSGENDAPPLPEVFLAMDEMLATSGIALASIYITNAIESLQAGTRPDNTQQAFRAYLERFGLPEQLKSGLFQERFGGQSFATEEEAIISELGTIKTRLEKIRDFFKQNLLYICASETEKKNIGTCTETCGDAFAWVCAGGGADNTLVICPNYWSLGALKTSFGLIHEASHLVFGFADPKGDTMTPELRGRNPVCYSGFVASIDGLNPPDPDCPALDLPAAPAAGVQPKLTIGAVNTPEEKQADEVAEAIVNNQNTNIESATKHPVVQRLCSECEEDVQPKSFGR